jgi:hypothetical protein
MARSYGVLLAIMTGHDLHIYHLYLISRGNECFHSFDALALESANSDIGCGPFSMFATKKLVWDGPL